MFQNKMYLSLLFFMGCLFLTPQNSLAQDLEVQYKAAMNKGEANKAGILAYQIAQKYYKEGNEQEAITYLTEATNFSLKVKDYENLGNVYSLLGVIYKKQENYNLAIFNYSKATQVYNLLGDKKRVASSHYLEGILYADAGQYDKAITVLKETINIANQANATDLVLQSTEYLSKVYRKKGDSSNANLYENVTEEVKDQAQDRTVLEEQKEKALTIEELEERNSFKSDSLEQLYSKAIAEREADKKLFTYIVIGVAVTIILLIVLVIIQRIKLKKKAKSH